VAVPSLGSRVLQKSEADSLAVQYSPREFPASPNESAIEFVRMRTEHENPDFRLDRVVSVTSGIEELERVSLSERVESEALERLKQMQEEAYNQGYDLGRDEGQESAYRELSGAISERIEKIDQTVANLEAMQTDLVRRNEASLISLVYQLAKKIAMTEIQEKPELILEVLRQAAMDAQDEQSLIVRLSSQDLQFLESMKERLSKDFEFMKRAKLEESADIQPGGCVIVTNYGQVDASIEKRLDKVWATLSEVRPKAEDVMAPPESREE
jgi:flagellar assembly protein FliH